MSGIFTISLDYELHWGVFDKRDREQRKVNYKNTLNLISQLLQAFSERGVHVTWATVGALFAASKAEFEMLKPESYLQPDYHNKSLSAYKHIEENALIEDLSWVYFAPDSVRLIPQYEGQELGTHTFAHYYCLEPGQKIEQFAADIDSAIKAADIFGEKMVSLVFPRNQFNAEYLKVCFDKGIKVVRSNPDQWFWSGTTDENTSLVRKLFRTGDTYIALGKNTSYPINSLRITQGEPLQLPASRFLRPYHPKYKFLNTMRLKRILSEMEMAAKRNECYHLWWHPENFGDHPQESLRDLKIIIDKFRKLQQKFGMVSWNMKEYAQHFKLL